VTSAVRRRPTAESRAGARQVASVRSRPILGVNAGARVGAGPALAVALLAAPAAPASSPVYVSVNAGGRVLEARPARIHLVSNDNLSRLRWSSWGGKTARASGTDLGSHPSPGRKASNPVLVTATDRRRCGPKLVYTTIRLHFQRGVPYAGQPRDIKYSYGCPS
jgi:hypothetical protein